MPTYDYRCNACGHAFEEFQSITAPVMRKCPKCGKLKLERLIGTGAGVIFKGGGFYETDYRSDSYKKAAEAEKKSSSDGGGATKASGDGAASPGAPTKDPAPAKTETTASKPDGGAKKSSRPSSGRSGRRSGKRGA